MRRVLLPFVISLFLPLQVFSTPCERVAFATGGGFAVVRSFESKIDFVTLIERYNPQFDLQLKKEGYSRDQFRRLINSNNRSLVFLKNFFWGKVYGENKFFVVELRSYFMDRSSPLIGRVIRKISQSRALVEVVTVSGDLKRVEVEIEAAFKFDYYDEGNIDIFNLGFKVFMRSSDFDIRVQQGNSRLEMVFRALKSNLRRVDSSVLLVPHKTNEELKLKEQGFSSAYVRGIDKVNEWISVVNQLRKLKVNPYKTHIEYFVGSIEAHIERVREGLDPSNVYALRTLERLKRHAERTVQREEVTYYWWLRFNYALSKVSDFTMSNADIMRGRSILRGVERNNLVNRFPAYIVMPTIIGKMGVMAINRANQADIYIGGLISGKGTGHGEELVSPEWFFDHDISTHAVNAINGKSTYRDNDHSERYDLLVEKMGSLTGEKRKHVELAFYILMHERGDAAFLEKRFLYIQSLIHSTLSAQIYNKFNFRGLLDTSSNERIAEQIREVVDDFMEIVKEVKDPAEPEF